MASDINRVNLIGRMTRDPELREVRSGSKVCTFSIANNRSYTTNGERRDSVSFFNCVAWGRQAEIINQYCRKGKQVAVDGRLEQSTWQDQGGQNRSSVQVVVESLQMLASPQNDGSGGGYQQQGHHGGQYRPPAPSYGGGGHGNGGGHAGGYSQQSTAQAGGFTEPAPPYGGDQFDEDDIPF